MWIDVKIPYEPGNGLAKAYNRSMLNSTAPWVLLMDHDLFLSLNPHWYDICLEVVERASNDVGMITCVTNGNSDRAQGPGVPVVKRADLDEHVEIAKHLYEEHGVSTHEATNKYLAGYFMLVNWKAWNKIRFRNQGKGVNKIDQDFAQRLLDDGYRILVMEGLYVYHRKHVRKLNWKWMHQS